MELCDANSQYQEYAKSKKLMITEIQPFTCTTIPLWIFLKSAGICRETDIINIIHVKAREKTKVAVKPSTVCSERTSMQLKYEVKQLK